MKYTNRGTRSLQAVAATFALTALTAVGQHAQAEPINLLYETDADAGAGNEFFLRSFASSGDLIAGNLGAGSFSQLDLAGNFSVSGLTYDGSGYHLLYETDSDAGAGNEFFLRSFSSLNDLIAGNLGAGSFSQLDLAGNFSVSGFDYDGSGYNLLYETDTDAGAGSEFFLRSFGSLNDLIAGNLGAGSFSQLDLAGNFSVSGMASTLADPSSVPEPSTLALLGLGLAGMGFARRRKQV